MKILGLMSGTSLDGIDAALVDLRPLPSGYAIACERFATIPFEPQFRERLVAALPPHEPSVANGAELDVAFGRALARAAQQVCEDASIDAVASHGLTLYHRGEAGITLQIGAPYVLRDECRATVVYDFRRADCSLGGLGAPLVPHFDALVFGASDRDVVALNLGGIANVSVIPRGTNVVSAAWDTGPANMLVDAFVESRTNGVEEFDVGGEFALSGRADGVTLEALVNSERAYFEALPPKSTGRERFGTQFLRRHAAALATFSLEDGCATLVAFTVRTIADSLRSFGPQQARLVYSGGGARNRALVDGLRAALNPRGWEVVSSSAFGVNPDAKEAIAFAVFAYETLRGRPSNVPAATGASAPAILGSIVPCELDALLAKIRAEVAANGSL